MAIDTSIAKFNDEQQIVFGWAYVSHMPDGTQVFDFSGDFIEDPGVIEKAAYQYVMDSRSGDVMHNGKVVATLVESMVFTPDKVEKMGLPEGTCPTGWWIGMKVLDRTVWADVKKGRWKAFSIGGTGVRVDVED